MRLEASQKRRGVVGEVIRLPRCIGGFNQGVFVLAERGLWGYHYGNALFPLFMTSFALNMSSSPILPTQVSVLGKASLYGEKALAEARFGSVAPGFAHPVVCWARSARGRKKTFAGTWRLHVTNSMDTRVLLASLRLLCPSDEPELGCPVPQTLPQTRQSFRRSGGLRRWGGLRECVPATRRRNGVRGARRRQGRRGNRPPRNRATAWG